jgi:hypothetical protein
MLKTFAATALSATLALATLAPTPARAAEQEDLAKLLFGVGIAALIAKSLNDQNNNDDDDDDDDDDHDHHHGYSDRDVYVHRYTTREPPAPRRPVVVPPPSRRVIVPQKPRTVVTQPPRVKEMYRVVPGSCQRTFRSDGANRAFVTRACLEREGVRTSSLPDQCERILDMPGDIQNRRAWNSTCLQSYGYRIR